MLRRVAKWALRLSLVLLGLGFVYVTVLVFPNPFFAHVRGFGAYRVYSGEPIPDDFARVVEDIERRVGAMEHEPANVGHRIFLCGPRRYGFYAFLLRKSPESLAIGLSVANESFVSVEWVRRFAETNRGTLRHTRFEGNLAEVVAHEIAHFNSLHAVGYRAHVRQPLWKSEGWAEYQANLAAIRSDPDYDLAQRIGVLLDDGYWGGRHGLARFLWESQLLVEFLGEVEDFHLIDLLAAEMTLDSARERMLAWYRSRPIPEQSAPNG